MPARVDPSTAQGKHDSPALRTAGGACFRVEFAGGPSFRPFGRMGLLIFSWVFIKRRGTFEQTSTVRKILRRAASAARTRYGGLPFEAQCKPFETQGKQVPACRQAGSSPLQNVPRGTFCAGPAHSGLLEQSCCPALLFHVKQFLTPTSPFAANALREVGGTHDCSTWNILRKPSALQFA